MTFQSRLSTNKGNILFFQLQWTPLNGITFGHTITDPINRIITITTYISYKNMQLRDIWDLFKAGQFDTMTQMIPLA